jgi:cellulose synthase/poly-beta-1,6-N-acetylglucosamine synthase-like glycosyltransferase
VIEGAFWVAVVLLGYTYFGYPLLVCMWARFRPQPPRSLDWEPTISVLIAAYDEAPRIATKIQNVLGLDYPPDRLEVLIGSDGSNDATVDRARAFEGPAVRVLAFPARRGKPAVINDLAAAARNEILVMADVRQVFDKGALLALVRPLADPAVGAVSGELVFFAEDLGTGVEQGIGAYWRYEKLIRRSESLVDSTVGATGAIYAIRRDLFEPLPEDTLLDDVLLPVRVIRRGYRVVFEAGALAFDRAAVASGDELTRKVRTIAGTFQLFWREHWLLSPRANRVWFQTVSHKGLRLLGPVLLAIALGTSIPLAGKSPYGAALAVQGLFYTLALGGALARSSRTRLLAVPYTFCLLNWATVLALCGLLQNRQRVTWRKASA